MTPRATFKSANTALVSGQTISLPAITAGDRITFIVALPTNDRNVTATIGAATLSQIASPVIGAGALKLSGAGSYVFDYVAPSAITAGTSLVVTHSTLQSNGSAAPTTRSAVTGVVHQGYGSGWSLAYISGNSITASPTTVAPSIASVVEGTIEISIVTDAETDVSSTYGTSAWIVGGWLDVVATNYNTTSSAPQVSTAFGVRYIPSPFGVATIGGRRWTATNDDVNVPTTLWTLGYRPDNIGPSANAGVDQIVEPWATATLSGSGTDSDGTIASYSWTQTCGPTVTLSGSGATRTFQTPATNEGVALGFTLTVTDNDGATAQDSTGILVRPATELYLSSGGSWTPMQTTLL